MAIFVFLALKEAPAQGWIFVCGVHAYVNREEMNDENREKYFLGLCFLREKINQYSG